MKKVLILLVAVFGLSLAANAQSRAIGARIGYGGELSYQHSFGSNFAEFDLGWFSRGFDIVGTYDFVLAGNGQVNLYAGPGAQLGFYNYDGGSHLNIGIAGQLGVEWNIPAIPLQLSVDWRPVYFLMHEGGFGYDSVGLGIRYRF